MKYKMYINTTRGILAYIVASAFVGGTALAQDAPAKVESRIAAFSILQDEDGEDIRKPATTIAPGGVIEYQLSYRNISDEALSDFVILGDVPEATIYIAGGSVDTVPAVFEVSVAGIGWATPPIVRYVKDEAGALRSVNVPESEFEALRWRLAEPIIPGEEVSATYRIKVEE